VEGAHVNILGIHRSRGVRGKPGPQGPDLISETFGHNAFRQPGEPRCWTNG